MKAFIQIMLTDPQNNEILFKLFRDTIGIHSRNLDGVLHTLGGISLDTPWAVAGLGEAEFAKLVELFELAITRLFPGSWS